MHPNVSRATVDMWSEAQAERQKVVGLEKYK